MATEEHKELAHYLKEVHSKLRKDSSKIGSDLAWKHHCEDKVALKRYALYMEKLATTHWAENFTSKTSTATCRIKWVTDFCYNYFVNKAFLQQRQKEIDIATKINFALDIEESHSKPIKLLDVGSCYNPFKVFDWLDVTAIDLCPANESVLECDFLNISFGTGIKSLYGKIKQLPQNNYDVVTFCFLLEYIPTSELRIMACKNAYEILRPGGLLLITTPDSKHVGANAKIMKCWQYTLAKLGFMRIKYEKFKHMHCMAYRKALCKDIAVRWTILHKKLYMEYTLCIPQDYSTSDGGEKANSTKIEIKPEDFQELPFYEEHN